MQPGTAKTAGDSTAAESTDEDSSPTPGAETRPTENPRAREIGGRGGPDPTRYGDWEKNGRCIDF